jgi:hypothetical protein
MYHVGTKLKESPKATHHKDMSPVEEMRRADKYENEILEVIDNKDDYTRSDLQGRISAIVLNIMRGH